MRHLVYTLAALSASPAYAQGWGNVAKQEEETGFSWTAPLWPSGSVTLSSTDLASPAGMVAGEIAISSLSLVRRTPSAACPPKNTTAPSTNPVPVRVTSVPPVTDPLAGTMLPIVGIGLMGGSYAYAAGRVAVDPSSCRTDTSTVPCPGGEEQVIPVAPLTATAVAS